MSISQRLSPAISDVDLAQSEVDSARGRLMATIEQIQQRIAPSTLVDEALDQMKARSADIAHSAGQVVRERPATVAATAAGIGLLLAAKPLSHLFRKRKRREDETPAPRRRSVRIRKPITSVSEG